MRGGAAPVDSGKLLGHRGQLQRRREVALKQAHHRRAERHDAGAGIDDGPVPDLSRPRRALHDAAATHPERVHRAEHLVETRGCVIVGRVAQRDADVLELALDVLPRRQVAGAEELRTARQHEVGVVVGVAVAVLGCQPRRPRGSPGRTGASSPTAGSAFRRPPRRRRRATCRPARGSRRAPPTRRRRRRRPPLPRPRS